MHVLLAVFFFLVSSMVKVHGKHPVRMCRCVFDWVACVCANDRLLCLSRGGLHRHSFFFVFCACKTSPGQAIVAFLLWQKRRADQDSFFLAPLLRGCLHVSLEFIGLDSPKMRPKNSSV